MMGPSYASVEQLISDLKDQVSKLTEELEEANKHIKDFELAAIEWKKGYSDLNRKHRIELEHAQQIIEDLEEELKQLRNLSG